MYKNVPTQTLRCKLQKIRVYNDATGWFVAETDDHVAVVGVCMPKPPTGMVISIEGSWQDSAKWGKQFRATAIRYEDVTMAILALLKGGFLKYVKDTLAESIVSKLGEETFTVLDLAVANDLSALKRFFAVRGIGKVTGPAILESWQKQRGWVHNALICIRAGLNMQQSKKAHLHFGEELPQVIRENPYRLSVIRGIGWETVDRIAQEEWPDKQPVPHDSPFRYAAAVREVLSRSHSDEHVCLPESMAVSQAAELATPADFNVFCETVESDAFDEDLRFVYLDGDKYVYTKESWDEENGIAENLKRLMSGNIKVIDWSVVDPKVGQYTDVVMSPDQVEAVKLVCGHAVTLITGSPGTGKSTTLKAIFNIMVDHGLSITMCAPTGKAAVRMTQAVGYPASTIHRAMGLPRNEGDFLTDVVIIDESSMIDQWLMSTVLKHIPTGHRLILVGDGDQLPPVGPGEPFYQMLNTPSIPLVRLTHIHRQGKDSGIVHVAHAFNNGEVPDVSEYDDLKIEVVGSNEALPARAIQIVEGLMDSGVKQEDIMLLTPLNKHEWGQEAMNRRFKSRYNPGLSDWDRMPGVLFDVDDPVIHIRNNYELNVMNGEIGRVVSAMTKAQEQESRYESEPGELPVVVEVNYGNGRTVGYNRDDLSELRLAYAMTVHKVQGSECQVVVMLVPATRETFELRQLAYTGLTRAKKFAHVVTSGGALARYVKNEQRVHRYTNLNRL